MLGEQTGLTGVFHFVHSDAGQCTMDELHLIPEYRDLLLYFASMMLDPEGHQRWMAEIRAELNDPD